jgi:hypothetical protein
LEHEAFTVPHELPTHRFFFSFTTLSFKMDQTERGKQLYRGLFSIIDSYYVESLALLRATTKLFEKVDEDDRESEKEFSNRITGLKEVFEQEDAVEESELFELAKIRAMEQRRSDGILLDLETNIYSSGAIVQSLSLLESTLYSIYKIIVTIDNHLPEINVICKRDKGIVKYLKYFEKTLISTTSPILVGTPLYQKIHQWIDFRNNIVHNNNDIKEELLLMIQQYNLPVDTSEGKFIFSFDNIQNLADLCATTLDVIIEEVLITYFIASGAAIVG